MRKFIDIIKEFADLDFNRDGGGDGSQTVHVYDIAWDHEDDGSADELPAECFITVDTDGDIEEEIAEELSNRYGYCTLSYMYRLV